MFNRHFRPEISDIKQARSVLYISLAMVAWMPSSGIVYNIDSLTITMILLRHFVAMMIPDRQDARDNSDIRMYIEITA